MAESSRSSLQSIILSLQEFWAEQGCLIWQPHHTEVGAGTMNPATFLRVLGPEDWWVAYVEPSIRPQDARYGENPNRWGHYYQFQVILKPDPGDPIERYLDSLVAIGIDPTKHDIRFVEDNWESPALGAWGLGWEVWQDGQEITQFTYFQQAGGQPLDPVSVEITYGLERILLALQDVDSFVDLRWNEQLTYGDVNLRAEQEHSRYNFEVADVERLRVMYDEFEAEAESCLASGLVFPAHDYVLKCSHTFNLLDGRGSIGVTERAALFGRMRDLSRKVADAYLAQREEIGFPWRDRWGIQVVSTPKSEETPSPESSSPFLMEIGTEELPASDLSSALEQISDAIEAMLSENRLAHGVVKVFGTPRRLGVYVEDLAVEQTEQVVLERGPPADRAFDNKENPTSAAKGFADSHGVAIDSLEVREVEGGKYVFAEIRHPGQPVDLVLAKSLPSLFDGIRFDQSMRWNASGVIFSRPIRWLLLLHGEHVIPLEYAGINSGRLTRTLRFEPKEVVEIADPEAYFRAIEASGIILDVEDRKTEIQQQIEKLARDVDCEIPRDDDLLTEVANLVERPTALIGRFDESYLSLPTSVLVSVMKSHQRYFPLERSGKLTPYFIAVRNGGNDNIDVVVRGNEQVIRARFADAKYFIERDLQTPLEAYLPRLEKMTFQNQLGSMLEKAQRVERLTANLAEILDLNDRERKVAIRAAHVAKADLATLMVVEMTSLQGEVGKEYALKAGESPAVAQAIKEHYLPRFSGDQLPDSKPGLAVGLADRVDTLIGLFAVGLQPTGTRDPYGLRRAAVGLVQILVEKDIRIDLEQALRLGADGLPVKSTPEVVEKCLEFISARQQALLLGEGLSYDAVEAALAAQAHDPRGAYLAVQDVERWRQREDWPETLQSFARCARITRGEAEIYPFDPGALVESEEKELHKTFKAAEKKAKAPGSVEDFLTAFHIMIPAITEFFDEVLVMAEDQILRKNRLGLLQKIVALADGVVNLSKLEGF